MITLYHAPRSRSSSIVWLLEELEVPYRIELTPIVYGNGQGSEAPESYRRIHPHKKVPAIEHDGVIVHECAAITLYLADAFPKAGLAPAIGDPARGPYVTWLAYWAGPMNAIATAHFRGWDKESPTGFGTRDDLVNFISNTLEAQSFIAGKSSTAADVLVAEALNFLMTGGVLPKKPIFTDYVERLAARPARARAMAKDNG
ncbi:MAG: glutathione S-transferase [Alphaproteobacteria bacterium]|nr:glutathione S-transferase [Alphaproteobacteria bacterium]